MGKYILGIGIALFLGNLLTDISIFALMQAKIIPLDGPPTWSWIVLVASIWIIVIGGVIASIQYGRKS